MKKTMSTEKEKTARGKVKIQQTELLKIKQFYALIKKPEFLLIDLSDTAVDAAGKEHYSYLLDHLEQTLGLGNYEGKGLGIEVPDKAEDRRR